MGEYGDHLYPYPTNVMREIGTLLSGLRAPGSVTVKEMAQSGWAVIGFGMKLGIGEEHPPMSEVTSALRAELPGNLEKLHAALAPQGDAVADNSALLLLLQLVIPAVLDLIKEWMRQ
jgi:hypothetical protein